MDKPVDQTDSMPVDNAVDLQSPDRKVVRRRFVQSTLFPLKAHDAKVQNCDKKEVNKVEVIDEDDKVCCGSQEGKRKRGRKPKQNTTPKKRGPKKVEVIDGDEGDKDDECTGSPGKRKRGSTPKRNGTPQKRGPKKKVEVIDDGDNGDECFESPEKRRRGSTPKRNATPQKRGPKKVALSGKDASIVDVDDIESPDDGSPQQLKGKQRASTRNGRTNGNKGTTKMPSHPVATLSQSVPDLWLEAKRTAEENSRLFAGKQIHPFFSSRKVGKRDQETPEMESNGLDKKKERNAELCPIHVFENAEDNLDSIDWSNWSFSDGMFSKTTYQERTISSLENSSDSINLDTNNILNPFRTSLLLKDVSWGQYSGAYEDTSLISTSVSPIIIDEEGISVTPDDLLEYIEKDFEVNKLGFITNNVDHLISEPEQQNAVLRDRIRSYYLNRGNHPENSLWTSKYQPEKALEVCGNTEAVKFINEWLRLWHATDFRVNKRSSKADKSLSEDDCDSYDSDSDLETGLRNVLLVTGPVGSGKSAAVYACAKEQGFEVVEVNASDWRNGALLKQKFGEAVGSHCLKRSQGNPKGSQSKLKLMSSPAVFANGSAALDLNHGVEVISLSEDEDSVGGAGMKRAGDQGEIKTLILFEDVDATLCEDRGFISTIQQLADTAKRPMILTSNSANPVLPDNLDREEVCFMMPSLTELIHHIYLVCAAEKANVLPHLIERCIQFCRGDIRKILLHLQFWCHSKRHVEDKKVRSKHSPLEFDLDAGHCILPKLINLKLPSSLSEFVEEEIAKSMCRMRMEESHGLLEVIEEEVETTSLQNNMDFYKGETASIEAKKEAILRENFFQHEDSDIIAINNTCEFSNSSGSPVAFTRRNVRRKLDAVLSDSEDEICNRECPVVEDGFRDNNNNNSLIPAVDSNVSIHCPPVDVSSNAVGDLLFYPGAVNAELIRVSSETADPNHIKISAVDDSCNQSIHHGVHHIEADSAKFQHHHLDLVLGNHTSLGTANDLNLFGAQLVHSGERKIERSENQFPVLGHVHEDFTTLGYSKTLSTDLAINFGEENAVETGMGIVNHNQEAANHCMNPLSDQLQHCREAKTAVTRCLFPQTPQADLITCTLSSTLNQSTDQLSLCGEASMVEFQHQDQYLEMGIVNHDNQEVVNNSLNPLLDQFHCHGKVTMANIEDQLPETENMYPFSHPAVGESFNRSSDQPFHSVQAIGQDSQHQHPGNVNTIHHLFSEPVDVDDGSCPAVENSPKPLSGKIHEQNEQNAEDHQLEYSEATNGNHSIYQCQSVDISCVPESSFVPETEVIDGKELLSGADLTEVVSRIAADNVNSSVLMHKASEYVQCDIDLNVQCDIDLNVNVRDEEMGDSQSENEHLEASTSGCQVMDECSRMGFYKRSKGFRSSKLVAKNFVQERWNELRKTDLRQHFILEHNNAVEVVELASEMSNLISEADLLLHGCNFITNDSLDHELGLGDETFTFGWHNQQVRMASAIAEHGYCFYAKDTDALLSKMGIDERVNLPWEMLTSTDNAMALGKLLRLDRSGTESSLAGRSLKESAPTVDISFKSEREMCLQNIALSTVPLRSYLALRGNALHEYLSSLAHISKSEASRLAVAAETSKRRRVRLAKNYLSSGGLDLSPDDISMLTEYSNYGKILSQSTYANSR